MVGNSKKIIFIRIIQNILFFVIIGVGVNISGKILTPKWMGAEDNYMGKIARGYEDEKENTLDVIFMGNSDVYRGITPIELYEKSGITAYNYVSPGQRMSIAYYLMENALLTQNPEVIMLNMDAAFFNSKPAACNVYKGIINLPDSVVKFKALNDDNLYLEDEIKKNCRFPILMFHQRATQLEREDFTEVFGNNHYAYKGLDLTYDQVEYVDGDYMDDVNDKEISIAESAIDYLDKMVSLCKDKNIELVLMELPSADSWCYQKNITTDKYAKKNGLKFIDLNMNLDEIGIDWMTDTSDGGDHLNIYGARKCTEFINGYLSENFDLTDHRGDSGYSQWDKDLEEYKECIK